MANSSAAMLSDESAVTGFDRGEGPIDMSLAASFQIPGKAGGLKQQIFSDIKNGNHAGAIAGLQKALAIRKKDPRILTWLVLVASHADDIFLARKYARKLVEVEPQKVDNHVLHGTMLDRLGRFEEAIRAYTKANRLQPNTPKVLLGLGRAHATNGDHEEALSYFERALEIEPENDAALHSFAQSKKFNEEEGPAFLSRIDAALPKAANDEKKARLHFAAGKVLDDIKRYDEAFLRFQSANDLVTPPNIRDMSLMFRNTLAAFPDKKFFESRLDRGLPVDRPIFIVGMPRSGTTLTESLCAAHPLVTAGDEQNALGALAVFMGRDKSDDVYPDMAASLTAEHATIFANAYLEHCEQTVGSATPYFTDKMPHNFLNIGMIALLFPKAKIIHCRRHPLDSCLSLYSKHMSQKFHLQYKSDLGTLGAHYRDYLDLMAHWRKVCPNEILEIFYEDLVVNTEWNARALISFLGLDWDDRVLDRSSVQRRVATASQWQVRQPVYQSSMGRWRRYENHLGPLIEAIGRDRIEAYEEELAALDRK